ncbi:MAG: hypothetical protein IPL61_11725 [Myxococcales bacterium]|nr:hypothetical protein [Myxococcales bacterium]
MASTRLILGLSAALALVAGSAAAQSPAQKADTLNDQGKALIKAKKYVEATEKFRAAIVLSPEGRFYLNLCMSLYSEGKLGEAITACRAVKDHGASGDQVTQANNIIDQFIAPKMRAAGLDPDAVDGGTGNTGNTGNPDGTGNTGNPDGTGNTGNPDGTGTTGNPDGTGTTGNPDGTGNTGNPDGTGTTGTTGTTGSNFTVAPPPSLFDQVAAKPTHEYTWTLGAQLLGMRTNVGRAGDWAKGTAGIRILGDYALSRNRQFGAQGHFTFFSVDGTDAGSYADESITFLDFGASVYKELCRGRMCVKPLVGAQIGLLAVDQDNQFAVLGLRGEVGLEYALGKRYENVVTVALGVDAYLAAQEGDNGADPALYDLDRASSNLYFGLGYTRRFNTPLGSSPMFSLQ